MRNKISACIVVYNEEKVIKRCLDSIKNVVDEIILVHDGPCKDRTLEIAKRYTNKIFIRPHVGMMESTSCFCL
jgi:Glycosyltransferases involved in cell wall biogenesis